jgi:hypothetical protein
MVYFKNICLILTVIFLKFCNFSNGYIFSSVSYLSSHIFKIFEAKCYRNVERERGKKKKSGGEELWKEREKKKKKGEINEK